MKLINNTKDFLASLKLDSKLSLPIKNFQIDSRKVQKNSVFFGLNGLNEDGSLYVEDAIKQGASLAIIKKSKTVNSISHSSASLSVSRVREAKLQESPLTSSGNGMAWFVIGLEGGARFTPIYPFWFG